MSKIFLQCFFFTKIYVFIIPGKIILYSTSLNKGKKETFFDVGIAKNTSKEHNEQMKRNERSIQLRNS